MIFKTRLAKLVAKDWHPFFAIWPRRVYTKGNRVSLQWIERKIYCDVDDEMSVIYRLPGSHTHSSPDLYVW